MKGRWMVVIATAFESGTATVACPIHSACTIRVSVLFQCNVDVTANGLRYSVVQKELAETPLKEGIATLGELEASDMSSPLYTRDDNVNLLTSVTLRSYLYIDEAGYYAFRLRSNNPNDVGDSLWVSRRWTGFA